jgi:hypothetical protein
VTRLRGGFGDGGAPPQRRRDAELAVGVARSAGWQRDDETRSAAVVFGHFYAAAVRTDDLVDHRDESKSRGAVRAEAEALTLRMTAAPAQWTVDVAVRGPSPGLRAAVVVDEPA